MNREPHQQLLHKLTLLTCLLLLPLELLAQVTLKGRVVLEHSREPLSGILVESEGVEVYSAPDGTFRLQGLPSGRRHISFSGITIQHLSQTIQIPVTEVHDLGDVELMPTQAIDDGTFAGMIDDQAISNEEGDGQEVSTMMIFSNDVFLKKAGYALSPFRYRTRGYDPIFEERYINGVAFNEQVRGVFNYSAIGALNDLTRNASTVNYIGASDFGFGDLAGASNINMRPSTYARGGKVTLSGANRNYYSRAMLSYNTGLLDNGLAVSALIGGRYAHEGVVEGTFYRNVSYALGLEYVWDDRRHSLSFVTFGSPVVRGQQGSSVDEAVQLVGCTTYNPNWGYQDGKKRNARVVRSYDPTAILSYVWSPSRETQWTTGVAVHYNRYGRSSLNWFDAADPRPDYYRYLPSYYAESPEVQDYYTYLWQQGKAAQIDWHRMYEVNHNQVRTADGRAKYMLEERRSDLLEVSLNSTFNTRIGAHSYLTAGLGYRHSTSYQFNTVADLLGASYALDVDKFAERDFPGDTETIQNDLRRPGRRVYEGDTFGYDYRYYLHSGQLFVQQQHRLYHWDIYYGSRVQYSTLQRDGRMQNGRYPDSSYGLGQLHSFLTYDAKAGVVYKVDGRHFISLNTALRSRAPLAYNMYVSPDITDTAIDDPKPLTAAHVDLNYTFSTPVLTGRVGLFYTHISNDTKKVAYYYDNERTFVYHTLYDIEKVHRGIELGLNLRVSDALNFDLIGTAAQYYYANNPMGVMNSTNGKITDRREQVYMKNLYLGGIPQVIGTFGINYFVDYWFLNLSANYAAMNHIDPAPIRRLASNYTTVVPPGIVGHDPKQYAAYEEITTQERFAPAMTLDASVGKIIYLRGGQRINLNVSVSNLLNNRNIKTGGYEQGRISLDHPEHFRSKHYYMQGINLFVNASYLF